MFVGGVVRVGSGGAVDISEDGSGLAEGDLVLAEIPRRFARVPFELHTPSLAAGRRLRQHGAPVQTGAKGRQDNRPGDLAGFAMPFGGGDQQRGR